VLFEDMTDLLASFKGGIRSVNGHRARMGFMFDHDDLRAMKVA